MTTFKIKTQTFIHSNIEHMKQISSQNITSLQNHHSTNKTHSYYERKNPNKQNLMPLNIHKLYMKENILHAR